MLSERLIMQSLFEISKSLTWTKQSEAYLKWDDEFPFQSQEFLDLFSKFLLIWKK
jgi:hypothetical protein